MEEQCTKTSSAKTNLAQMTALATTVFALYMQITFAREDKELENAPYIASLGLLAGFGIMMTIFMPKIGNKRNNAPSVTERGVELVEISRQGEEEEKSSAFLAQESIPNDMGQRQALNSMPPVIQNEKLYKYLEHFLSRHLTVINGVEIGAVSTFYPLHTRDNWLSLYIISSIIYSISFSSKALREFIDHKHKNNSAKTQITEHFSPIEKNEFLKIAIFAFLGSTMLALSVMDVIQKKEAFGIPNRLFSTFGLISLGSPLGIFINRFFPKNRYIQFLSSNFFSGMINPGDFSWYNYIRLLICGAMLGYESRELATYGARLPKHHQNSLKLLSKLEQENPGLLLAISNAAKEFDSHTTHNILYNPIHRPLSKKSKILMHFSCIALPWLSYAMYGEIKTFVDQASGLYTLLCSYHLSKHVKKHANEYKIVAGIDYMLNKNLMFLGIFYCYILREWDRLYGSKYPEEMAFSAEVMTPLCGALFGMLGGTIYASEYKQLHISENEQAALKNEIKAENRELPIKITVHAARCISFLASALKIDNPPVPENPPASIASNPYTFLFVNERPVTTQFQKNGRATMTATSIGADVSRALRAFL